MKHRVREAIFNLIGMEVRGKHAIDLFAGTGAIGLEALSRGAAGATFVEQHIPTSQLLRENIELLDVVAKTSLCVTSAFLWVQRDLTGYAPNCDLRPFPSRGKSKGKSPKPPGESDGQTWAVFCSPPYDFYTSREAEMAELAGQLLRLVPAGSLIVFEADQRFDFASWNLPATDVRQYPPATIGVVRT